MVTSHEGVQKQERETEEHRVMQEEASERMQSMHNTQNAADRQQQAKVGAQASRAHLFILHQLWT